MFSWAMLGNMGNVGRALGWVACIVWRPIANILIFDDGIQPDVSMLHSRSNSLHFIAYDIFHFSKGFLS